jgi:mono/diheme cytochrome c family protein
MPWNPQRGLVTLTLGLCAALGASAQTGQIEFNRDIRPILSDRCYACHGPDQAARKSKLRLDTEAGAKADLGGRFGIVPGDPAKSEVIRRITANEASRMPPAWAGAPRLTDRETERVLRWVQQGAVWQKHWSFIPPVRPEVPAVSNPLWPKNAIDYFVMARLDSEGLKASPEADRRTLIRRATLDLTGLPPPPSQVEAFVSDQSPDAYEKVVDRLLASPRYGERMAGPWLNAARYADTNGYQTDGERSMWRWRDWVIDAFNRNMPFDRFTVEQIAGDMLPNATLQQRLATGFNRNHRGNGEGGIIAEEYAVEYVVDRVETTSAVWLGVTLGCARCHNHKFDPFTQKEFYQAFAYFNNVPERGKAFKYGNSPPTILAPTAAQELRLSALDAKLSNAEHQLAAHESEISKRQQAWEKSLASRPEIAWSMDRTAAATLALGGSLNGEFHQDPSKSEKYTYLMENGPAVVATPPPESVEPAWKDGAGQYAEGRIGPAAVFDGKRYIEVGPIANFGFYDAFTLAAWIYPAAGTGAIVTRAQDQPEGQGFGLYLKNNRLQATLVQRWLDDGARVESEASVPLHRWSHVILTYDGSRQAAGVHLYLNGQPVRTNVQLDDLNQSFAARDPLRIGAGLGPENRFRGLIQDVRVFRTAISTDEAALLAEPAFLKQLAGMPPADRTPAQANKLRWCFLDRYAPTKFRAFRKQSLDLREQRTRLLDTFPTVMVMRESEVPRETHVLIRGAYDRPGEKVSPGVPSALPGLPPGAPNNRLGFAMWLVDSSNPLTARVTMNRFWQMYFGAGLVKTVEDFGSQGEWPLHRELLDWLSTEFVATGWDVKAMQRAILLSATYRQSSKFSPELLQRDPENRLLARGPRLRLPAETLRDQALAVSGLLVEKIGGPSVRPYQPPGLWKELTGGEDYRPDTGEALHRRSLYTFWKRTSPPPTMMNFDAAGRETCVVRESRTNTPLQSLDLMNDPAYLEAARSLAYRMIREGGRSPGERISYAFLLATARRPKPRELEILLSGYDHHRNIFEADRSAAIKYVTIGVGAPDPGVDGTDLAAYMTSASVIFNLDVTVTKE